jgi:dTDP-4-amino-4,6-dideoxygalactose transaminase
MKIHFNVPFSTGREVEFISQAIDSGHTAGNGPFTKRCSSILEEDQGYGSTLLTSSCTDALEMAAMLINIKPGDEVIVPAYTFVSTALAFARQGAVIVFADSRSENPCIDEEKIENLITSRTKAIVPVHYNGIACEMDRIMEVANKNNLWVIEDAAHAFGSKYKGRPLGTIGHLGCLSFHETKIIHCGEGGMISLNDRQFVERAEIILEKGTNRCDFSRGKVSKYEWIDSGSSFLMSDLSAAFLYAQLLDYKNILDKREHQWNLYLEKLSPLSVAGLLKLPVITGGSEANYSGFFFTTRNRDEKNLLLERLNKSGIQALTHYLSLAESPYILKHQTTYTNTIPCLNSKRYENTLIRLPVFYSLTEEDITFITEKIISFYKETFKNDL